MSGWQVYDLTSVHVVPEAGSDQIEHDLDSDCICGPDIEFTEGRPLVTHHSLDGRERYE